MCLCSRESTHCGGSSPEKNVWAFLILPNAPLAVNWAGDAYIPSDRWAWPLHPAVAPNPSLPILAQTAVSDITVEAHHRGCLFQKRLKWGRTGYKHRHLMLLRDLRSQVSAAMENAGLPLKGCGFSQRMSERLSFIQTRLCRSAKTSIKGHLVSASEMYLLSCEVAQTREGAGGRVRVWTGAGAGELLSPSRLPCLNWAKSFRVSGFRLLKEGWMLNIGCTLKSPGFL